MSASVSFYRGLDKQIWGGSRYNLVYLDPIVCDLKLSKPLARFLLRQQPHDYVEFLDHLLKTLGGRAKRKNLASLLKQGKLGATRQQEGELQKRITDAIIQHTPHTRYYQSVAFLQRYTLALTSIANKPKGESLVVVDAMCARKACAPLQIQRMFDVLFQDSGGRQNRGLECILTDLPAPLMAPEKPVIGLVVDSTAFYARGTTAFMRSDWYPFTRTVGLYSTTYDGLPYLEVLAILVRPHPTLDRVLSPGPGNLPTLLARLQEEVEKEVDDLRGRASATGDSKKRELEFLYPLYYFLLCCQLNGLDGQGLQSRAPDVAGVLKEYLRSLQELKAQFERLGIKGLLVSQETDIMKLLPEPTEV